VGTRTGTTTTSAWYRAGRARGDPWAQPATVRRERSGRACREPDANGTQTSSQSNPRTVICAAAISSLPGASGVENKTQYSPIWPVSGRNAKETLGDFEVRTGGLDSA